MKKWAIVAGCAVAAAIALWLTVFQPSEDDRIREVLSRFTKVMSIRSEENILSRAGRVRSELKETVTDVVYVDVPDLNVRTTSRAALGENAVKATMVFTSADCELTSIKIKVDDAATTAQVDALALVTGERGGERKVDKRPVHFGLRKDGSWRITSIDVSPSRPD